MSALQCGLLNPITSLTSRIPLDVGLPADAFLVNLPRLPDKWNRVFSELNLMYHLQDDWDGAGADVPDPAIISFALALAREWKNNFCEAPSRVTPTLDGGISFEWKKNGIYRELELIRPGYGELMTIEPNEPTRHQKISEEFLQVFERRGSVAASAASD